MLYIGLMSGTSLDGVDASLIDTDAINYFKPIENLYLPYPRYCSDILRNLIFGKECNIYTLLNSEKLITEFHITASNNLLTKVGIDKSKIRAIGFHGVTLFHDALKRLSMQIGNPHYLAQEMNIDVVYDFRRRDIALGGQGAPLVPIFHKLIMCDEKKPLAIINIGGVSNITYIGIDSEIISFDIGTGNGLINDAMRKYFDKDFDNFGTIASGGNVDHSVIEEVMSNKYFLKSYPKSLDRNEFSFMFEKISSSSFEDQIATLTFFTARSIYDSIKLLPDVPKKIYFSGGGSKNRTIIKWVRNLISENYKNCEIDFISNKENLDADFIESQAFAYLAARCVNDISSTFPSTTGAIRENVCGSLVKV